MNNYKTNLAILSFTLFASIASLQLWQMPHSEKLIREPQFNAVMPTDSTKIIHKAEHVMDCPVTSSADITVTSKMNGLSKTTVENLKAGGRTFNTDSTYTFYTTLINDQIVKIHVNFSPKFNYIIIGNTDGITYSITYNYASNTRSRIKCVPVEVPVNDTAWYEPCTEYDCTGAKGKNYDNK